MNKNLYMAAIVVTTVATVLVGCGKSGDTSTVAVPEGIEITARHHTITNEEGGKVFAEGTYPEIILSDECTGKYPKLDEFIKDFNAKKKADTTETTASDAEHAKEFEDMKFSNSEKVEILRADEKMVSFRVDSYWEAGAHPMSYVNVINVDPTTGEELQLSQVLNDTSDLKTEIIKKIKEEYPNLYEEYVENQEDSFLPDLETGPGEDYSITETGLNLYFDETTFSYMAMPDEGVELTFPYDDYPNLVKKEYSLYKTQ